MRARLFLAIAAATVVVLSGPFVGEINNALQNTFPGQHLRIVFAAVVAPGAIAIVAAIARIRERRALRVGAMALALIVAVVYVRVMEPLPTEQFHLTEYGLLTFLFYRVWQPRGDVTSLVLPVAATFVAGMADEWFQWFVPSRVGELRDVVLNGVGVTCGLLFAVGMNPPSGAGTAKQRLHRRERDPQWSEAEFHWWPVDAQSARALGIGAGVLVVCTAIFLQCVHMGFEIADPGIGTFRSRYSTLELRELSADRSARWLTPLLPQPLISREDHYLSEARFHIQERNDRLEDGDAVSAWRENRILEAYYGPVLELAIPASRWPPEQRADVEIRAAADTRPYVSDAYPLPIYAWNPVAFWATVVVLAGAIAAWTVSRRRSEPVTAAA